ncbi:hypothetical protein [Mucilaginibacter glaciei]|uniref:Uncharacterized protein n=1 Tax=Mucilaginibacter glaciei TaxID=2772109 RepID=A0A926NZK7_9SPHI|nr:hypothetical protein [Mucilaginibacter glaciei]MBD1394843.1 hypothetical protein [Mucilaginibacter glaciei]
MRKLLFAAGLLMLAPNLLIAQFNSSGGTTTTPDAVGIGITSSLANKLHVFSNTSLDGVSADGVNPAFTLRNNGTLMGYAPGLITTSNTHFPGTMAGDIAFRANSGRFLFGTTGNNATMSVANGRVAIGNLNGTYLNPGYPLTVSSYVGSGLGYLSAMFTIILRHYLNLVSAWKMSVTGDVVIVSWLRQMVHHSAREILL